MYKQAALLKLRFDTQVGVLSTERLFDLSMNQINELGIELESKIKSSESLGFSTVQNVNETDLLKYKILEDVYNTKRTAQENIDKQRQIKEREQVLLKLIKEKEDENLRDKSIDELQEELKKLKQ